MFQILYALYSSLTPITLSHLELHFTRRILTIGDINDFDWEHCTNLTSLKFSIPELHNLNEQLEMTAGLRGMLNHVSFYNVYTKQRESKAYEEILHGYLEPRFV
jgi:hypothetical protein